MTISELRAKKQELEEKISNLLKKFTEDTAITVTDIKLNNCIHLSPFNTKDYLSTYNVTVNLDI